MASGRMVAVPRRAFLILLVLLGAVPLRAVKEGEFASAYHSKLVWSLYASMHNRGLAEGWKLAERFGAGFDLSFLLSPSKPHPVNKLLYFTVDNTFSDFLDRRFVWSVTPAFLVRTWIPLFKFGYAAGVNVRTDFDGPVRWAPSVSAMLEFYHVYLSSRLILPTDGRPVENELKAGILIYGKARR